MSIQCTQVQAELPLFVGGDLESPGREWVAEHLESCPSCRSAAARAGQARAALTQQFERTAELQSSSVWPSLRERLLQEGLIVGASAGTTPLERAPVARGRFLRFASFTAAAAALVLLGSVAGDWYARSAGGARPANAVVEVQPSAGDSPLHPDPGASPLLPAQRSSSLREVTPAESFTRDAGLFEEGRIEPFNAFAGDGLRSASYPGPVSRLRAAHYRGFR